MKTLLLISILLLCSCASHVTVRYSTCNKLGDDIYKCEEAK